MAKPLMVFHAVITDVRRDVSTEAELTLKIANPSARYALKPANDFWQGTFGCVPTCAPSAMKHQFWPILFEKGHVPFGQISHSCFF